MDIFTDTSKRISIQRSGTCLTIIPDLERLIRVNPLGKNWQQFANLGGEHMTMRQIESITIYLILKAMHT